MRNLLETMVDIARAAGDAIMGVYGAQCAPHACDAYRKQDGSPVTEADMLAHDLITSQLRALKGNLVVVSEEDPSSHPHRTSSGSFWLVDPLDGTKEFLSRTGEFTVNIALIEQGSAVAGVVVAPAAGLTYWGAPGVGAWRDAGAGPIPLAVDPGGARTQLRVIASRSHLDDDTRAYLRTLGAHTLVQAGSSLKFCRIAEGSADLYPRFGPTCEWDVAAAHAVLEAAGGQVTCLDGLPLRYGKSSVVNPPFIATSRMGLRSPTPLAQGPTYSP